MNILFDKFPDTVCVNGEAYQIETDFREWIRFAKLVEDEDIPWQIKCRLLLQWYIDGVPDDLETAVYTLGDFLAMKTENAEEDESVFTVHFERCMELICRRFLICTGGSFRHYLQVFRKRRRSSRELCTGA